MLKLVAVLLLVLVAVVSAQQGAYDQFFNLNTARDPRTNTGPIQFPPAPPSLDSSGVVVGASGYGFVPPGTQNRRPLSVGRHFF
ncbi:uncharacterized protein LOC124549533 [Schistocerca americana]|uniref:uncharacterized protein LOC124549533 n=1 Tax=Schistocerca americana TaxID=7009 RepID=UPI001F4F5D9E|nr:uncharacterized protein LOC124549533 [Schistocerca americana]XP_047116411.1 uncharacterized protein LOC124796322 [Schistocerca piceifrons]XP_049762973.1 uncharacterized protein LOC126090849 [Schistocerca cancellata]XP_049799856.1 uncharacterized protein LOC126235163 [Schistocerca nitens]XP_049951789.1 uncharacterized protein LOC126459013 isoform X2 [Schistocerca serialis cubense]